jgi:hypothetical protein
VVKLLLLERRELGLERGKLNPGKGGREARRVTLTGWH